MAYNNILAIDTALGACGVAVVCGSEAFDEQEVMNRGYADALLPMVERVLAQAALDYKDLDAIAVTLGPGAFTGIRVGISAAKALGVALDIPVYGLTSFDAMRLSVPEGQRTLCVLESKREAFFVQSFGDDVGFTQPAMVCSHDIKNIASGSDGSVTVVGDGGLRLRGEVEGKDLDHFIFSNQSYSSTKDIAFALQNDPLKPYFTSDISAFYMRDADVSTSKRLQRKLASSVR